MDYYEILGIDENATQEQIKASYRALAKKYHPDVNDAPNAAAFFRLIQEAYETLSDPRKRDEYVGSFGRRTCKRIITWRLDMVLGNIWIRFSHFPYGT